MSDKVSRKRLYDSLRSAQPLVNGTIIYNSNSSNKQELVNMMNIKNTLPHTTESLLKRMHVIEQILSWRKLPTFLCRSKRAYWRGYLDKYFGPFGQLTLDIYLYKGIYLAMTERLGDPVMILAHCDGRWTNITPLFDIE